MNITQIESGKTHAHELAHTHIHTHTHTHKLKHPSTTTTKKSVTFTYNGKEIKRITKLFKETRIKIEFRRQYKT
jgi:hypothetical protein